MTAKAKRLKEGNFNVTSDKRISIVIVHGINWTKIVLNRL